MMEAILKLIILGEIPGTSLQLGYIESLYIAGAAILLTIVNYSFLRQHKRVFKDSARSVLHKDVELKTI